MKKILIANRGEIASRISQTCNRLGITPVLVYSDADKNLPYIRNNEKAYNIGESLASKSYLNQDKILEIAKKENVDAIHPGYGFLSENPKFARAVEDLGIKFIGPKADIIEEMGNKVKARNAMKNAGVPVVPGSFRPIKNIDEAIDIAEKIGFPIMLKSSAGGGGIGMQRCFTKHDLIQAFDNTKKKANLYFNNSELFIEKMIDNGRHIEVQILGDTYGNIIHLYERDCSIQRRNQKVLEETPTPFLSQTSKSDMYNASIKAANYIGYENAGTIEFIVDENENFYFLEMNTRLQVEHPITEEITGVDLVENQINIARGERLKFSQSDILQEGHSIEFRLYAEDPKTFFPSPGTINEFIYPKMSGTRVDTGVESGSIVSQFYDPMIAKIVICGDDRQKAIDKALKFSKSTSITGIKSNISLFVDILSNDNFIIGNYTTNFLKGY